MKSTCAAESAAGLSDLIKEIVQNLVNDPSSVEVRLTEGATAVIYEISVAAEDTGQVIGKGGKLAASLRTITSAIGTRLGKKTNITIIEPKEHRATA